MQPRQRKRTRGPSWPLLAVLVVVVGSLLIALPGLGHQPERSKQALRTEPKTLLERPAEAKPRSPQITPPAGPAATTGPTASPPTAGNPALPLATPTTVGPWPSASPGTTAPPVQLSPKPEGPATGAYLGAYVDPYQHEGYLYAYQEVAGLPLFHQQVPRKLGLVSTYQAWGAWIQNVTLLQIATEEGALPMVSWRCGDSDANINAGKDDTFIYEYAKQLQSYGRPVLMRWYWEMNLMMSSKCLDTGNPNATVDEKAAGYVAAWRRIHDIFQLAGATNVAFVWCPSTGAVAQPMDKFYPGDDSVDWICADGYDRQHRGATAFRTQFQQWYDLYASHGKPMMVGETGAPPDDQVAFLKGVAADGPTMFPALKALIYFHGEGNQQDWRLDEASGGVQAFNDLGATSFFAPMPGAT